MDDILHCSPGAKFNASIYKTMISASVYYIPATLRSRSTPPYAMCPSRSSIECKLRADESKV